MANIDLETAGYLRRLIDIGASGDKETGSFRETYAPATVLVDGSGNIIVPSSGALTNNNAAPGTANTGVLGALANAAAPSWTEGNQVLLSVDLSGRQRVAGTLTNNGASPAASGLLGTMPAVANAAAQSWTEGRQTLLSVDLSGRQRVIGTLTNNNAALAGNLFGAMTAVANAAAPSWTEANEVVLSVDLSGNLRATGVLSNNAAAPGGTNVGALTAVANAASPSITEGRQALLSTDLAGAMRARGVKTHNNAAPTGDNLGVLPAIANAAAPTFTEGDQVLVSTDLSGRARITGGLTNNNAAPSSNNIGALIGVANAAAPTYTEGDQVLASMDLSGNKRTTLGTLLSGEDQGNNILRVGLKGGGWNVQHNPATNTKATISQAAGGGTVRNVITGFDFSVATDATAPTAIQLIVNLRDGATGAGTVLRSWNVGIQAVAGYAYAFGLAGLWIECSQNTQTTLEFTAVGGAHTYESVNLSGVTIAS
jgi:hypothetical protein